MAYMIAYDWNEFYPLMPILLVNDIIEWVIYLDEIVEELSNQKISKMDDRYKIKSVFKKLKD